MERVKVNNIVNTIVKHLTCSSQNKTPRKTIISKGDSGASSHYIRPQDADVMSNITTQRGEEVTQPDGTTMAIEHVGQLPMHPTLSDQAKKGHILRNLKSASLVALGP